jgi:hypothetical protein
MNNKLPLLITVFQVVFQFFRAGPVKHPFAEAEHLSVLQERFERRMICLVIRI